MQESSFTKKKTFRVSHASASDFDVMLFLAAAAALLLLGGLERERDDF